MTIDLNADVGEGFGGDAELLAIVSSANIACGLHAGSPEIAAETMELAISRGVAIGAHPGYHDRANFGREAVELADEGIGILAYQIGALVGLAGVFEAELAHVKLHGAMNHLAHDDADFADLVSGVVGRWNLSLVGLPGGELERAADDAELRFIREGFADRRLQADGSLVPRGESNALIADPAEAFDHIRRQIDERGVQSICIHGDAPGAVAFATAIRTKLEAAGFIIAPPND